MAWEVWVSSSDPTVNLALLVQLAAPVLVAFLGNGALLVLAVIRSRRSPSAGWRWLLAAGALGLLATLAEPALSIVAVAAGSRLGADAILQAGAGAAVLSSAVRLGWWGLLGRGIHVIATAGTADPVAFREPSARGQNGGEGPR